MPEPKDLLDLQSHIEDQKRRYQNVALNFEQADLVLKMIDVLVDRHLQTVADYGRKPCFVVRHLQKATT